MPQIGQPPGSLRIICGCMGHTYSVRVGGGVVLIGCRTMGSGAAGWTKRDGSARNFSKQRWLQKL